MFKKILIIDDEPVILEISKRKLSAQGYEVMVARDGEEGLGQIALAVPDLILLDVDMPKMNGYTFMMEKAKTPLWKDIPVIVLTSHNEMEPIFRRHKIKAYLLKPLQLQELLIKVAEVIGPGSTPTQ